MKQAKSKNIMTYSVDFSKQVIESIKQQGMIIRQSCEFYDMIKATLQNWLKEPRIKLTCNKLPSKTPN